MNQPEQRRISPNFSAQDRIKFDNRHILDSLDASDGLITSETDVAEKLTGKQIKARNGVLNAIMRTTKAGKTAYVMGPPNDQLSDPILELHRLEPEQ